MARSTRVDQSILLTYLDTGAFRATLPRAVGLQVLHPAIAASFDDHVHTSVWGHKTRSVEALIRLAYDPGHAMWTIRYAHEHVKGIDANGDRYHALDPELFHFQHATYVDALFTAIGVYGPGLRDDQRDQLYAECCQWYAGYGISTRPVPETWESFVAYFSEACAGLAVTAAGERFGREVLRPPRWSIGHVPRFAARAVQHSRAKELLGVHLSSAERAAWQLYTAARRAH
ncbi:oxygenase MpaB family protein [Tsukamurella pseudospumae]|uniref:ER-bound oxygenase mpaB/mpaB'/Rubber oxygenase catalytic domain-containing protein n=1 Tax=Tsukamurella pseudospumae TaxID=239498 RepID=A0A137ZDB6_9ACTN|nr:oxygenase MpaB family protein [Tsukamurella pseudospumae]KXO96159.1 hypothetical protein AXK61_23545 [Tsukamurella pseudospumae]